MEFIKNIYFFTYGNANFASLRTVSFLQQLQYIKNEALDIQLKVFNEHKEEDMIEFSHRLEDIRSELEYPFEGQYNLCLCQK